MTTSPQEPAPQPASTRGGTKDHPQHTPLLIEAKAAAAMLSLGARTLWSLTKCRAVPSHRVGRAVRYSPAELRAWVVAGCPSAPGAADRIRRDFANGVAR